MAGSCRDMMIIFAGAYDGIFHIAEYSLLLGVKLKDLPPGIGTCQQILAKYGLAAQRCAYIGISEEYRLAYRPIYMIFDII